MTESNERAVVVCTAELAHAPESREAIEKAFNVRYCQSEAAVRAAMPEASGYLTGLQIRVTDELMALAPRLKAISTPSTGLDHIDLAAAERRDIRVLCLKDDREFLDKITATAELTWALVLACSRRVVPAVSAAKQGKWARDLFRGHQIAYKTFGILGCGRLGTMVAQYAQAFRMRVIGHDIAPVSIEGVEMVSFEELLRLSDFLSVHIHLTEQNRGLLSRDALSQMKTGAVLINTSRGAIIDEEALRDSLESGQLAAAGLDVIHGEWSAQLDRHPLIRYMQDHDNLVITPHIGGVTYESQEMAYSAAISKLVEVLG